MAEEIFLKQGDRIFLHNYMQKTVLAVTALLYHSTEPAWLYLLLYISKKAEELSFAQYLFK